MMEGVPAVPVGVAGKSPVVEVGCCDPIIANPPITMTTLRRAIMMTVRVEDRAGGGG